MRASLTDGERRIPYSWSCKKKGEVIPGYVQFRYSGLWWNQRTAGRSTGQLLCDKEQGKCLKRVRYNGRWLNLRRYTTERHAV